MKTRQKNIIRALLITALAFLVFSGSYVAFPATGGFARMTPPVYTASGPSSPGLESNGLKSSLSLAYPPDDTYPGMHANPGNSERVFINGPGAVRTGWKALENCIIFQPAAMSADGKFIYAVVAKKDGCRLAAVDTRTGDARCLTEKEDDLSMGVLACGPEVDRDGFVYVTDGWGEPGGAGPQPSVISFYPGGGIRWKSEPLVNTRRPSPRRRAPLGLHFTPKGYIASVTPEGMVFLLSRDTGKILASLDLPRVTGFSGFARERKNYTIPPYLHEKIKSIIGDISKQELVYALSGGIGDSGCFTDNTIGVSGTNQLFVVGGRRKSGDNGPDRGGLFAVNITETKDGPKLSFCWVMTITGGSGTSPSIDPGGRRVVVGDASSTLSCARIDECNANTDVDPDSEKCAPEWTFRCPGKALNGSVSIDEHGIVYAWNRGKDNSMPDIFAVRADPVHRGHAKIVWRTRLGDNMNWSSTALILNNMVIGTVTRIDHAIEIPGLSVPLVLQCSHMLTALDRNTGKKIWSIPVDDDSINSPFPGPDGTIYVPLMGMIDLVSPNPEIAWHGGIIQYLPRKAR